MRCLRPEMQVKLRQAPPGEHLATASINLMMVMQSRADATSKCCG